MRFLKDHRPSAFGDPDRQRRNPTSDKREHRWVSGALSSVVLTVTACEWITPLDFGGNSNRPTNDAGNDVEGGDGGTGGATTGGECPNGCSNNLICKGGTCACAVGQTECNDICTGSLEDAGYCGASCVDLNTDSQHCGACGNACPSGQSCLNGTCKSSPCDGLCASPNIVSASNDSTGYRFDTLGSAELCIAIENYVPTATNPRIVCWNLDTTLRPLQVDGQAVPCETGDGYALPQQSSGWYCVQVGAGTDNSAGLLLPTI